MKRNYVSGTSRSIRRMKVLNICDADHANFSHENANSLRSVGVDCIDLKLQKHPFGYDSQSTIVNTQFMIGAIKAADIVQVFHTWDFGLSYARTQGKKRITVWHTGTTYRRSPEKWNDIFNPHISVAFSDQCEFKNLGAKNYTYCATAIDCKKWFPEHRPVGRPYIFGHFPSHEHKGTKEILEMLHRINLEKFFVLNYSDRKVSHEGQKARMNEVDCYIELFKPELFGKPYGCFGVTAFEAAALGKMVVTQNIHEETYKAVYGDCALEIANTPESFNEVINRILSMSPEKIREKQRDSRHWLEKNHSYENNGLRLKKILENL